MKIVSKKFSSQESGAALPLVMIVIVILLMIGTGLLTLGMHGRIFAIRTASQIAARCAADAGLTQAIFEMNEKKKASPWDDITLPDATDQALPNCDATFSYTVTGDADTGYAVQSIGKSGRAQREVNAGLRLKGLFDFGILVKDTVTLHSAVLVDGYNSSDASQSDVFVQVATVNPDPDSIVLKPGASIDGETLFGVNPDFPPVYPPEFSDTSPAIYGKGKTAKIGPENSGKYTDITLLGEELPGVLEISGGDVVLHITGDVWMGQGCEMIIRPDSSLTIYLDGNWVGGNSSGVNNQTQIPANFAIYGTGEDQQLELKAKSDWYGVVYAPEADIIIKAKSDVYGSFVANSLDNKAEGFVWYDAALREVSVDDLGVRFVVERWYEQ